MGIPAWESFLERHIEGFFNKKFGTELEPAEVQKQLEHEVQRRRKKGREGALVPNAYTICVSAEDYHRLCSRSFKNELYRIVEKTVISADAFMEGKLEVSLEKKPDLSLGVCEVHSCYSDGEAARETKPEEPENHTIVLNRSAFYPPLNLPEEHKTASLTVIEGPDMDAYLEFGERQIYIGRRDKNDFILTDMNSSRLHAYITYERHRHVLLDAGSLNGTFVNQRKIEAACLCVGDRIRIGNTVLLYGVI